MPDPDSTQKSKDAALMSACEGGKLAAVKKLLASGADIQAVNGEPLKLAAQNGHLKIAEFLLSRGADLHAADDKALRYAVLYNNIDAVRFLLQKGACIDARSGEALRHAVTAGSLDMVKYLVEQGADLRAADGKVFAYARRQRRTAILQYLASIHLIDRIATEERVRSYKGYSGKALIKDKMRRKILLEYVDVPLVFFALSADDVTETLTKVCPHLKNLEDKALPEVSWQEAFARLGILEQYRNIEASRRIKKEPPATARPHFKRR